MIPTNNPATTEEEFPIPSLKLLPQSNSSTDLFASTLRRYPDQRTSTSRSKKNILPPLPLCEAKHSNNPPPSREARIRSIIQARESQKARSREKARLYMRSKEERAMLLNSSTGRQSEVFSTPTSQKMQECNQSSSGFKTGEMDLEQKVLVRQFNEAEAQYKVPNCQEPKQQSRDITIQKQQIPETVATTQQIPTPQLTQRLAIDNQISESIQPVVHTQLNESESSLLIRHKDVNYRISYRQLERLYKKHNESCEQIVNELLAKRPHLMEVSDQIRKVIYVHFQRQKGKQEPVVMLNLDSNMDLE